MEKRRWLAPLGMGALLAGIIVTVPAVSATQNIDLDNAVAKLSFNRGTQEDEREGPDQAEAAALDYVGEGRVTGTEVGDEEGYYEVEVTFNDGTQVDVHLDENFQVISGDGEAEDEEDTND